MLRDATFIFSGQAGIFYYIERLLWKAIWREDKDFLWQVSPGQSF